MLPLLKARLQAAQLRAGLCVNREIVNFCWKAGSDLSSLPGPPSSRAATLISISKQLRPLCLEPGLCTPGNLESMIQFAQAWPDQAYVYDRLSILSWEHHLLLLKVKSASQRRRLAEQALKEGWEVGKLRGMVG